MLSGFHLKAKIQNDAEALGFDAVGFVRPDAASAAGKNLEAFLAAGRHGDMEWLARNAERRANPHVLWPEARSAVILGVSYAPAQDPLAALRKRDAGVISVYARGRDYHDVLKSKLKELARRSVAASGASVKIFVDTAPLMEKPLAAAAGLGWQGKHTNLVSRRHGSWLFLGVLLTTADLPPDPPGKDRCGHCRRCLDVCPTQAFPAPYQLDARRCLAYLTIEYKGHIAPEFRAPLGNRIFGCDDCLAVCPWNKFAKASREARFAVPETAGAPALTELLALDDAGFRRRFAGTPVKRTGRSRFLRNVLIAAGNSGNAALCSKIEPHLRDVSPLVRAMAAWALSRLLPEAVLAPLKARHLATEDDPDVRAGWENRRKTGDAGDGEPPLFQKSGL